MASGSREGQKNASTGGTRIKTQKYPDGVGGGVGTKQSSVKYSIGSGTISEFFKNGYLGLFEGGAQSRRHSGLSGMKSGAQPASTVVMLGGRQEGRGPNTAVLDLLVEGGWVTKTMVGSWKGKGHI